LRFPGVPVVSGGVGVRWRLGVRLTVRFFLGEDFFGFLLHKQPATRFEFFDDFLVLLLAIIYIF
tara:strand:- start:609 stop:800 length:192 start_codon:yes stop_codon:yes gene_type:complete